MDDVESSTGSRPSSVEKPKPETKTFRTYKRRFIGLAQLVLLNIVVSWNWLTFASVPEASSTFFGVSGSAVTWLSTSSLFAFVIGAPFMLWALNNHGPKYSILVGSAIILAGAWIRYAAGCVTSGGYGIAIAGQVIMALAQPFVLAVSTRYNKLWFSDRSQISATAAVALANPLGGAIGQLVAPAIAAKASGIPNPLLCTAIVSTVATIPAPFIPKEPPSPPSATATMERINFKAALRELGRNKLFLLLVVSFQVYVGLFDSTSSLYGEILIPYGFSQSDAGIAGAILIFAGVVISAIVSPILDRTKAYKTSITLIVPTIAACYTVFIFIPGTHSAGGLYAICAILGGASFSLMPMVLELLTEVTQPVSPEISSIVAWVGGDTLGGVLIIVMNALRASSGWAGQPSGTMMKGLILQAVLAWIAVPAPLIGIYMKGGNRLK